MIMDTGKMARRITVLALIIFAIGGWFWWSKIYNKPETLFWRMINNNLAMPSITRTVGSSGDGEAVQQVRINFGTSAVLQTQTTIKQESDAGNSSVVTETLATPKDVFVRYKSVDTSEKNQAGNALDFTKIVGVWAQQGSGEDTNPLREDYIQNILTLVAFGNFMPAERQDLVNQFKQAGVYQFDSSKVEHKTENGKKVSVYSVTLKTKKYAEVYQKYLEASGLGSLSALDPAGYTDEDTVEALFAVDGTATLRSITFLGNGRKENYSDFGLVATTQLPTQYVSIEELQQRLQQIQ